MSRVGKKPIKIPQGVEIKIEADRVTIKGPKGEISQEIPSGILVEKKENEILLSPKKEAKRMSAMWGLARALLQNHVKGVSEGFEKKLEIRGIGYKAALKDDKTLQLDVGFSHPVILKIPDGIKVSVEKNIIAVSGVDKQKVGEFAAEIRATRKPEPYKGKGIRYLGERVRRKEGKKAVTANV